MLKIFKLPYLLIFVTFFICNLNLANATTSNLENQAVIKPAEHGLYKKPYNISRVISKHKFQDLKTKRKVETLWKRLQTTGYATLQGKDSDLRTIVATLQGLIEENIVDSLASKDIVSVVGVIHTPTPSTPLRIKEKVPAEVIGEKYINNREVLQTLINRHKTLVKLLKLNGILIAAYSKSISKSKVSGYKNYLELVKSYPNLLDKPMKKFNLEYSGATYLMKSKNGVIKTFSIHADQINSQVEGEKKWEIWFGNIKNKNVAKHIVKIDSFLKDQDIDIYQCLN